MKFTTIALDLDGTTLNNAHEITPKVLSTLQHLVERPGQLVSIIVATGRSLPTAIPYIKQLLEFYKEPLYLVCYNGACGYRFITTSETMEGYQMELLFSCGMSEALTRPLVSLAARLELVLQYYHHATGDMVRS